MRLNSFSETEKFLKRCLKGKIDINKGIVIIFLMTGMIGYHNVSFSVQADTGKISYQQGQGHSISGGLAYGDSNSIAIGSTAWKYDAAHASGSGAIAVGTLSKAAGSTSVAVGYNSTAKNNDSLAIGYIAQAIGSRSIAFGGEAIADSTLNGANADSKFGTLDSNGIEAGTYSVPAIAIGSNSKATNRNTIAIGTFTKATGNRATALGSGAEANGEYSLAGGYLAKAEAKASIAIGEQAFSKTENSIVLGTEAKTSSISTHTNAVAIGNKAAAEHGSTIAIGNTAKATALQATAIGSKSEVSGDNSVAIGQEANSTGTRAVSLGVLTKSTADRTVAIGNASEARASDSMAIGSVAIANGGNSIALGKSANAIGNDSIVLGASSTSSSTSNIAIGDNVRVTGEYSLAIGSGTNVTRENSIAIGRNSSVSNQGAVAIGLGSETTGERAITLGNTAVTGGAATKASAKATDSVAIGNGAVAEAGNSLVLGLRANAMSTATNGVALGTNAKVEGNQALAIGSFANAKAIDSIAIGTNAVANLQNSVAIGNTSVTTAGTKETTGKIGEITYGDFAGALTNTNNVVSVGGGRLVPTRQIKNVAAGKVSSDSTDAINGSQLYATNNVIGNMAETLKTQVLGGNAEYEKAGDTAGKFTYTNIGETGKDNIHDAILASRDIVAAGTNIKDIKATTAGNGQVTYTVNAKGAEVALKDGEKNLSLTPNTDETTNITKYTIGLSATPTFETVNATNMYVTNVDESRGDSVTNKTYVDEKVDAVTLNTAGDNSTKGSVKLATQTLSVTAKATGDIEASTEAKDQGIVINIDSTAIDKKTTENATNITNNKNEINKLGENTIKLSSDSGDTETQNLSKDGGLNFKIAGVDGVTTEASGDTVKVKLNYDKVAENTPLTYKANGGNAQTTTLAKGLNFVNGDKTVATVDAAGVVKYDLNDETKTKIDNSMSSFKIKANSEAEETVSNGETVTFANGDNIEITRTGKTITVGTSKDITATTVNATNMTVTNVGDTDNSVTNKKYVDDKVGAVTLNTVGTTGEGSVKLKDQKLSVTTNTTGDITANTVANNQGIVINIDSSKLSNTSLSNITNEGETVIKNLAKAIVDVKGTGIVSVDKKDVNGVDTYTVSADTSNLADTNLSNITNTGKTVVSDIARDSVKVEKGTNTHVTSETVTNTDGTKTTTYKVSADKSLTTVNGSDLSLKTTMEIDAESGAESTQYELSLSEDTKKQLKKEESVEAGESGNVTVKEDGTNTTGGKKFVVDMSKTLNVDSVTINNGPVINKDGINMNNTKIKNVAEPTNATDATNKQYVDSGRAKVTSDDHSVTVKHDTNTNTYDLSVDTSSIANTTKLTYKANGGNAQTTTLAEGLNFVNGDKTVATVDAAGVVKYDLNDETKTKIDSSISSFKIQANNEAEEEITNGNTITFANGDNIEITRTGKTITVGTSKDITATTVNAKNMTVTNVGDTDNSVTNKKYVDDKVGAVTLNTVGTTGEGSVKLKDQKLSVTTNTTGDITANTVANNQGIVINIDSTAIDNKITENTTNITEVKELADKGLQFGANSGETVTNKLGSEVEITGSGTKEDEKYSSSNVKTKVSQNTDGKTTIEVMLDKDLTADTVTVGEKGADGKDGVDGKIGVNGKDGSAVVINGADGSIGLNGKDGANGLTIKGANGTDGVDGKNGTDGKTRIIYEKPDGTTEEVATLNDGMKYGGDTGDVIKKKLNEQVSVVGGVKEEAKLSTEDNLGVISDGSNNLTVRLAKDLKGITSISNGDTKITLGDNTINVDGAKITNVAKGTDPTDAVNVSQLTEVKELASKGFDITADDKTALGTKTKDNVAPGELLTFEGDSNITTHVSDNKIEVKLNKDLKDLTNVTVGEKGANGKDGVDGKIGVNGKDGSAVVINGADGSIGLNGKDGANGLTIKGANGADGVDGKNGTDGKTRIVYEIENPDGTKTTEEVATLNDGLRFAGNDEKENVHKLNSTVRIVGEGVDKDKATNFESASGNIAVVSTADDTLTLKLAKELKEINSVSNGDTKIVLGDNKTINIDGARITNVASPTENTDATNKEYVDSGRTKVTSDDHSVTVKHNEKTNTYDLSVDTSSIANTTKLTYKANGGNAQTTTLAEGLNFVNTTNITASVDEKGVVTHSLNKDLKDITSISNGDTKIILDKDGEGNKIVNVDGAKITNVANGEISETSTDAVNGSQLHSLKKEITSITGKGFNISADNGVTDNVALGETVKYTSSDKNVITKTTGNNEVDFTLNDKITLGEDKTKQIVLDSETGSVSVGDKVTIDGTTGDSKFDKVEINGKEGTVTGLTNTEWDVENPKAVSGRAATEDQLKVVNDKVNNISTTINDELGKNNVSYGGDTGDVIKKKLNEQVNIVGGIKDEEKLSKSPNVGVVSDGSNNLTIRLAKDLKDLSTITLVDESGNKTTINNSGMTISTTTADGTTKTVSLTENGLNNGGNKITNVAAGEDETDAVNVSQLNEVKNVVNNHADAIVNNAKKIDKLDSEMRHGFANAAAMATLKYMEIGVNQVTVGAALGTYKGTQAVAVGVQGAPTEDTRVHAQVSVSPGRNSTETMAGIGAAWRFNVK